MKFRAARHTDNLQPLIDFYVNLLDLSVLGSFKDHAGYDGVFIGKPNADWHLEFTTSKDIAAHQPDEDDLLVFYPENDTERDLILARFTKTRSIPLDAKNPYWNSNGHTFADPDGFRIVIADLNKTI